MRIHPRLACALTGAVIAVASLASALPVALEDSNGTKYNVNTQVVPLNTLSNASGALTNATFVQSPSVRGMATTPSGSRGGSGSTTRSAC
jgi:hypothetical protein